MIQPARDGILRVLRAARDAGVKRVVLTSAFGAIGVGHKHHKGPYTEEDWSNLDANLHPYQKSKTIAEKAAWEFIRQMLESAPRYVPKIHSDYVDVRDVADLHILAMLRPEANGQRFIASSAENLSLLDIAHILKKHLGEDANRVPKGELPNIVVRTLAIFNPKLRMIATLLGQDMSTSNQKAKRLLGWTPRSAEEAIAATGKSMVKIIRGQCSTE